MKVLLILCVAVILVVSIVSAMAITVDELERLVREFSHQEHDNGKQAINADSNDNSNDNTNDNSNDNNTNDNTNDNTIENTNDNSNDNAACCLPDTMQFRVVFDFSSKFSYNTYIDLRNNRLATKASRSQPTPLYRSIILCNPNRTCTGYSIDDDQKTCRKSLIQNVTIDTFWSRCLPDNSTKLPTATLGAEASGSNLVIQPWLITLSGRQFFVLTTGSSCIPVSGGRVNQGSLNSVFYVDLATRIKDSSVFVVPSYCNKAQAEEQHDDTSNIKGIDPFFLRYNFQ